MKKILNHSKDKCQKSQNCVKAAIAFVCTTCERQLLFALFQLITFVCTFATKNILCTIVIIYFCMHTLLQLLSVKYNKAMDNFYALLLLPTFAYTIANDHFCMDYCMLQISINSISCIAYNIHKLVAAL